MAILERYGSRLAPGDLSIPGQGVAQSRHQWRGDEAVGADFNRDWPDVTRTREILVLAEEFGAA